MSTPRIIPADAGTNIPSLRTLGSGAQQAMPGNTAVLLAANNFSDVTNTAVARANLGLGSLATMSSVDSAHIMDGTIMAADINAAAGILKSQLASLGIVDADVSAISQSKITGLIAALALLAPLASPALTGVPTVPTASPMTNNTQAASTAYADAAVAVETARAEAAEAALGTPITPSPAYGVLAVNSTATDFVLQLLIDANIDPNAAIQAQKLSFTNQTITAAGTLTDRSAVFVLADTTTAGYTILLPANPSLGTMFVFIDKAGTWNSHNLTVGLNGKLLNGSGTNPVLTQTYGRYGIVYDGTQWRSIINPAGVSNPTMDGTASPGSGHGFSREDHTHPSDTSRLAAANNLSDLANAGTARTNLGLGSAAVMPANIYDTEANIFALSASTYSGVLAFSTDTAVLFRSNGTAWKPLLWQKGIPVEDTGVLASSRVQDVTNNSTSMTSGDEMLVSVFVPRGVTITGIKMRWGGTAPTWGTNNDGHWYLVIRKQDGTLIASTADGGHTGIASGGGTSGTAIARDGSNNPAANWANNTKSDWYLVGAMVYLGTGGTPAAPTISARPSLGITGINSLTTVAGIAVHYSGITSGTPATAPGAPSTAQALPYMGLIYT